MDEEECDFYFGDAPYHRGLAAGGAKYIGEAAFDATLDSAVRPVHHVEPADTRLIRTHEGQALGGALVQLLDGQSSGYHIPQMLNEHVITRESTHKVRIHAPNSEAFIELMTPEKPDEVTTLCEEAVNLIDTHGQRLLVDGEPARVVPHPYLFAGTHIPNAEPQYAWLAYLANPQNEKEVLPSIIFTRDPAVQPELETPHTREGRKIGSLGFWEYNQQMHLVALGSSTTAYNMSNTPGDVADVAEIIHGIEASVRADELAKAAAAKRSAPDKLVFTKNPRTTTNETYLPLGNPKRVPPTYHTAKFERRPLILRLVNAKTLAIFMGATLVVNIGSDAVKPPHALSVHTYDFNPIRAAEMVASSFGLNTQEKVQKTTKPQGASCDPAILEQGVFTADTTTMGTLPSTSAELVDATGHVIGNVAAGDNQAIKTTLCATATSYEHEHPSAKQFEVSTSAFTTVAPSGRTKIGQYTLRVDLNH